MYDMLLNAVQSRTEPFGRKTLLLSINPDLKSDFGHFLNYEKRINELCSKAGVYHHCLSSVKFQTSRPYITGLFEHDSGHYCLYRKSAAGHEARHTAELHRLILEWINRTGSAKKFDEIVVFIYQSSGRSAAYLSCLEWPANTRVVANGFWDFLIKQDGAVELDLARLKLQSPVTFLAMSTSHRQLIRNEFGHEFEFIPNPPPLVSDKAFANLLRQSYAAKMVRERKQKVVFFPGLMSVGKGGDVTADFLSQIGTVFPDNPVIARDRSDSLKKALTDKVSSNLTFASGDYSDSEIIAFYENADVAVLPYSSEVFGFRTSGALVDCLMSSTIPVVFPNTWLAEMCRHYDFGVIAEAETVEALIKGAQFAVQDSKGQLQRMIGGALRYSQDNSWLAFLDALLGTGPASAKGAGLVDQFQELAANASMLNAKVPVGKAEPVGRVKGSVLLETLAGATDLDSAKLLLTSVGNGLLIAPDDQLAQLQRDPKLAEAVRRALIDLPDGDAHKSQFLRVWARFGDVALVSA